MNISKCGFIVLQNAIEFVRWADSFHRPITAQDIRDRWDVSRATSYRWLAAYNNVPTPLRQRPADKQHQVHA